MTDAADYSSTTGIRGYPSSALIVGLADEDDKLSPQAKKFAAFVLADVNFSTDVSISDILTDAGVSPTTVLRFFRRLGGPPFSDFEMRPVKSACVGVRVLRLGSGTDTAAEVAEDIVTKAQNAVFEMHRTLDLDRVEDDVALPTGADMIDAFGSGGHCSIIASDLRNRLFRLGARITGS